MINERTELHLCPNVEVCLVDQQRRSYACAEGYAGPLCATCDAEGFAMEGFECVKCGSDLEGWITIGLTAVFAAGVMFYISVVRKPDRFSYWGVVVKIGLGYTQYLTIMGIFKARGTQTFRRYVQYASTASGDVLGSSAVQC